MAFLEHNINTAELTGLSFGDGGLTYRTGTKSLRFQLRGSLRDDTEHYDNYIVALFKKEVISKLFIDHKVGIVFNKKAGFYGISKESKKLEWLNKDLGIPIGVKKELKIPLWIKENKTFMYRFLRGFLDTDGSVHCQRNYSIKNNKFHTQIRMNLASCSKNLITEIYQFLKKEKFKCILREGKRPAPWKTAYIISICGGIQVKKWFALIGSMNPKHITKFKIWKKHGFCPPYTSLGERKQILKNRVSPYDYYAGMPERSNGFEESKKFRPC